MPIKSPKILHTQLKLFFGDLNLIWLAIITESEDKSTAWPEFLSGLFAFAQSPNANHRENAISIMGQITPLVKDAYAQNFESVRNVIGAALVDPQSVKVSILFHYYWLKRSRSDTPQIYCFFNANICGIFNSNVAIYRYISYIMTNIGPSRGFKRYYLPLGPPQGRHYYAAIASLRACHARSRCCCVEREGL